MSVKKTIARSFTVETIEDGISVQAQYAPNANPTSSQIHNVWQDGDLYMRTRESDSSAWSSWHKIVGESGDETDFSFGISQYNTTANVTTAPSDITTWSDAPLAVTSSKPYLWAKVQKKSWNESTQQYQVDSTSYIRLTGEDGYTVQAQYAPNNNPTSSQIHTTWQDGDLYMRTKQSNETNWSSWHKIVGESGDETDYTFNISKSLTSTNATTAPANCYYNTWQDAPIAPTSTYPYLWMKVVKKTWNESTQSYDSGTPSYARITGEPGTSPYFADLNNEMDAIQCKHDGSVITDQTVSTVISMWKGSAVEAFVIDNIYRNGTQLTWDGNNNGVWPRVSGSTVSLEFTTSASIADIDDFKITIHSYNDNTVTRELHFTINGVRANAIYRLVPSHSQIVKKKDGTYEPSVNITCSVEKNENGLTSTPSSSEYTLQKSVNGSSYTTYSATSPSSITSDLKFRLEVGGVVVDLETIPLVSDGNKGETGDSAPVAYATPEKIAIPCNTDGSVASQITQFITFGMRVGSNGATSIRVDNPTSTPTGVSWSGTQANQGNLTISTSASASGMANGVTFKVTGAYGGKDYVSYVTVALLGTQKGNTGNRGNVGRFFYYAGVWSDFSSTDTFEVTDAQAPYFQYGGTTSSPNYWVFNTQQNGTYTKSQMGTPSSSSANWAEMWNDFKYIITEAIFGKYAHLGSFIVNGDFFISQYGTLFYNNSGTIVEYEASTWDDNHSTKAYTYFKTSDPMVDEMPSRGSYKFRPTKCINAKTGEEWMAGGNMHVSSGGDVSVKGTVQAQNLYRSVALVSRIGNNTVNQTRVSVMDVEGGYTVWLYFKQDVTVGTVTFEAQTYHKKSEYDSLLPEYSVDDLIGQGKVRLCTYAADEVFVTYNNQITSSGIVTVPLPRYQDFVGKIVTVRNDISSYVVNPFNATVVQCDDSDFAFASVFLSMNGYDISGGNSQNHVDVDSGDTAIFYATTTRWERLK